MAGNTIWENFHMYTQMYVDKSNDHIICIYNIVGGYSESVKLICQNWNLPQIGGETKHIWNHRYINGQYMVSRVGSTTLPWSNRPNRSGQVPALFTCKTSPTSPTRMKHAWHPWNSKISSLLAWAIALWHLPAAKKNRGRDENVMKGCVKSMCTNNLQSYEYSTCYAFIWDNYISLGRINTFWRGSKIHHIIHHAIYMYHIFMNHHLLQALVMLFGRTGNPIWVGILLWCCMFNYHTYQNMYLTLLHPCKIHRVLKFQQLDNSNFQPVPVP